MSLNARNVSDLMNLLGVKGTLITEERWSSLNEMSKSLLIYDVVSVYFMKEKKDEDIARTGS
jgi:hypothetical protein